MLGGLRLFTHSSRMWKQSLQVGQAGHGSGYPDLALAVLNCPRGV